MTKRRAFIKTGLKAAAGVGLFSSFRLNDDPPTAVGWNNLREQFTFDQGYHYFNTGTMGLSPKPVIRAYKDAIDRVNSKGEYNTNKSKLQNALARFIHCSPNEVALTRNVTEGINIAAWAVPLEAGDEVILCTHEHAGNAIPWLNRAKKDQLKIQLIELGTNGNQTLINLARAISSKTKVIALPHIPCTIGHVLPIQAICKLARAHNIYSCIDGAHGAGMLELNMKDIDCDFYSSCFHKWMLGPKGSGFLYIRDTLLPLTDSYFVGAYSDRSWDFKDGKVNYGGIITDSAMRHTFGSQSDPQFAAAKASIDFLNKLNMKKVEKKIKSLGRYLCQELLEIDDLHVYNSSTKKEQAGIVSFKSKTLHYNTLNALLKKEHFRLRTVAEAGLACIRVSTHIYNSKQEIDLLVRSIKKHVNAN